MTPSARRATTAALAIAAALAGSRLLASDEPVPTTAPSSAGAEGGVVVLRVDSIIHPVASEYVRDGLTEAEVSGAAAVVIELDTPGGLMDSTREITTAMLGARMPVLVFVAPPGAQAASAGFFILMAADVAAMAPGTNTGAAHPVGGAGETIEGVLGKKVEEDAAANIRSLAARNQRNIELAQSAVVDSKSFTAAEALEGKLVDLVANDRRRAARHGRRSHHHQERERARAAHDAARRCATST